MFLRSSLILVCLRIAGLAAASNEDDRNKDFWLKLGQVDLQDALKKLPNNGVAKNIIIFIGDGMGIPTITAARIYRGQTRKQNGEENFLAFEKFPHSALIKTYNVDKQVPDSAATATAIFSGVKTNYETLGLSPAAKSKDCNSSFENTVPTIVDWAQAAGKDTGFVTTTRITHATPAALYSKSAHRNWESDDIKPSNASRCKDIASQLIDQQPGINFKVIMGGGRRHLISVNQTDRRGNSGQRTDGRNLIDEWLKQKGGKSTYATTKSELLNVDPSKTDYVMGIFSANHMDYDIDRNDGEDGQPSLTEMTETAIKMLSKSEKGFFLLVEGGRIDHGHHANLAKKALHDTLALEDAISKALSMVNKKETLIIVTADHSHVMTINGYPKRGNNILGIGDVSDVDHVGYTTLMYTTGPSASNFSFENRTQLKSVDLNDKNYRPLSLVPHQDETHGGEDVALYSIGPMAHLFQGVHEQNYIAHVMAYAACVGVNQDHCTSGTSIPQTSFILLAFLVLIHLAKAHL